MPDSSYLKLEELKFGNEIEVYGKKIRIVNCDQFTRKYSSDVDLGEPEEVPTDIYTENRRVKDNYALRSQNIDRDFKNYIAAMSGQFLSSQPLGDYLKYDGKILIFKARWETTQLLFKYFYRQRKSKCWSRALLKEKIHFPRFSRETSFPGLEGAQERARRPAARHPVLWPKALQYRSNN